MYNIKNILTTISLQGWWPRFIFASIQPVSSFQKDIKQQARDFYNKILSVHSSQKQIGKIQAENRISKFRESMTLYREYVNLQIKEQIRAVNMKIEIWAQFIQNSYADQ
ncbi:Hypothetical_protein [Hexamita inflata]|uniref:Hypothetical_protein n=1 Tax=Hexamita inflata TaxID=28002 RepID=A0AA86NK89_9EUKA|nr:Hypothetical protein HINF_LOCUS8314 [Hexamita inflata]